MIGFWINIHDVGNPPPHKYCFLIGIYEYKMNSNETYICDVITLCFLVLKCLHQFSCSSYQKQGLPSTINKYLLNLQANYECLVHFRHKQQILSIHWVVYTSRHYVIALLFDCLADSYHIHACWLYQNTGPAQLIWSHSLATFSFELNENMN